MHAGAVPAADLPAIAACIVPAYVDGLRTEADTTSEADVREGFVISALLRSGFDSFLYDLIEQPSDEHAHTFAERVALCRFLADQAETVLVPSAG